MNAASQTSYNMDIPIIRVEYWNDGSPITIKYVCGDNEQDLEHVYAKVKSLPHHPGRAHIETIHSEDGSSHENLLHQCDKSFLETFFDCIAHMVDYFCDFLKHDSVEMRGVWFHLLDVLQDIEQGLPHKFWLKSTPACDHAHEFGFHLRNTFLLMNQVISPRDRGFVDPLVRPNVSLTTPSRIHLGGFKAGLKKWQQFLLNKSPGFTVPEAGHVYSHDITLYEKAGLERYIPMGALAIVQKHTDRARANIFKAAQSVAKGSAADNSFTGNPVSANSVAAKLLAEFDQYSFEFTQPAAYTSLDGRTVVVQPMHPNRAFPTTPRRYEGFGDFELRIDQPWPNLLDECIGMYKGGEPFQPLHQTNEVEMWKVTSSPPISDQAHLANQNQYDELFDDWMFDEDY